MSAVAQPVKYGPRKAPPPTEHQEQVVVMEWAALREHALPELRWLHAIPNAGAGAQRGQAGKLKAEGVKRGVFDLFLPVTRKGSAGLYIEMKRIGEKASQEQLAFQAAVRDQGYTAEVVQGATRAIELITAYLRSPK